MDQFELFFSGLTEHLRLKYEEYQTGPSIWDSMKGFFHAIDWTERWLFGLLFFHAQLLLLALLYRNDMNIQTGIFMFTLVGVYLAETLNTMGSQYWQSFAGQNYFDKYGVFTSVLWSGPLMIISVIILINMMRNVTKMMIKWKRAELKHKYRKSQMSKAD